MNRSNYLLWNVEQQKYITNFSSLSSANDIFRLLSSNIEGIKPQLILIGPLHTNHILEIDTEFIAMNKHGNIVLILTDTIASINNMLSRAFYIASVLQDMNYIEMNELHLKHHQSTLDIAYQSSFNQHFPAILNKHQEIILVRSQHRTDDYKQLSYLRTKYSIPINSVVLKQFSDKQSSYIIQDWLFEEDEVAEKLNKSVVITENKVHTQQTGVSYTNISKDIEIQKKQSVLSEQITPQSSTQQHDNKMYQSWTDAYAIGIEEIDKQHKFLFDTFDDLLEAVEKNETKEKIHIIIERLVMYGKFHFETEERLLELHHNSTHYLEHKNEHSYFIETVKQFHRDYRYGNKTLINDIILFLKKWFVVHVSGSDKDLINIKANHISSQQKVYA